MRGEVTVFLAKNTVPSPSLSPTPPLYFPRIPYTPTMIAYLSGRVKKKRERSLILLTQGVGYEVFVPQSVLAEAEEGKDLEVFVYTHVREDVFQLYGFSTEAEQAFFLLLLSVSGIGPKSGLEMLSVPMEHVKQAIVDKDIAMLTRVPGIGKKTAERILVELTGKVDALPLGTGARVTTSTHVDSDIIEALVGLGYDRGKVLRIVKELPSELTTDEEKMKYCLKHL
jgi:Holliday junction DNA helicase RuvA